MLLRKWGSIFLLSSIEVVSARDTLFLSVLPFRVVSAREERPCFVPRNDCFVPRNDCLVPQDDCLRLELSQFGNHQILNDI